MIIKNHIYKDISSVDENSSLRRVIKIMNLSRINAIPVENSLGEYIGCISEQDILDASVPMYMKSLYSTSFMADLNQVMINLRRIIDENVMQFVEKDYPTVSPNDTMSYAADLLYRRKKMILPVVESKRLLGLITRIEILSASIDTN